MFPLQIAKQKSFFYGFTLIVDSNTMVAYSTIIKALTSKTSYSREIWPTEITQ